MQQPAKAERRAEADQGLQVGDEDASGVRTPSQPIHVGSRLNAIPIGTARIAGASRLLHHQADQAIDAARGCGRLGRARPRRCATPASGIEFQQHIEKPEVVSGNCGSTGGHPGGRAGPAIGKAGAQNTTMAIAVNRIGQPTTSGSAMRCNRSLMKPQAPRRWKLRWAKKPAIRKNGRHPEHVDGRRTARQA